MARLLHQFVEPARPCSYLGEPLASLEYRVMVDVGPTELDGLLQRGWRRFGPAYFRPRCSPCAECVSLRLPVAEFAPSRGQRRVLRGGAQLRMEVGPVRIDEQRLDLYARWHATREQVRGWEPSPLDHEEYASQFGFPHPCAREIAYYDDSPAVGTTAPRLVGLGLCDETARAWSAIYFFHDPEYARYSPGVLHVLSLIRLTRDQGKDHLYLGFRINGCASMRYKALFRPHELLQGRPGPDEEPRWSRPTESG
jgi:arginyl-tRNA--protein-N-Asp/Glu arginylyltransferase